MPGSSAWGGSPSDLDLEGYRLLESTRAARIPAIVVSGVASADDVERDDVATGFAPALVQAFRQQHPAILDDAVVDRRHDAPDDAAEDHESVPPSR